ncbi:MAG: PEGA domain-containing protein [Vicinamibacterales bacterium]
MRRIRPIVLLAAIALVASTLWSSPVYAQRARVRVGVHVSSGPRYYRPFSHPYFYGPYDYDSFYWGTWWGPQPYGYGPRYYSDDASLRIQVSPRQAEVYIDGYYVGIVNSFDGTFQRLDVTPGEHVLEIFLEGHRSIREPMRFSPRASYQIRRAMEPLGPGEPPARRPAPDPNARQFSRREEPRDRRETPPPSRPGEPRIDIREGESGAVAVRVQPAGAVVLVDGEKWEGPDGPDRLVIHLSEGSHTVEVQKQGYRTFTTEIRVRRGETVPLNISLRTAGAN